VKEDLKLDNANLGLLGSLVYGGLVIGKISNNKDNVIGSLFAMPVFNYCNTKFVLITCLLLNSASLLLFTVSNIYYVLVLSRVLVGFFQVFFCIYFPVWVDLFADEKRKTAWLTFLLLGVPLGIILGYISTAVLVTYVDVSIILLTFIVEMDFLSTGRTFDSISLMLHVHSRKISSIYWEIWRS
jgi:MFS family permease